MTILFSTSNANQEDPYPMDDDLEALAEPDHAKPKLKP